MFESWFDCCLFINVIYLFNPKKTIMNHEACINALNDLVQINNDRIEGYKRAIEELKDDRDNDLKSLFNNMINESEGYRAELSQMVTRYGGEPAESSTVSGKLYRAWMDVKAVFTGGDRDTVLNNVEDGEDAAQKAYQMALDDDDVMAETKDLIARQKASLRESHDQMKALKDLESKR